MDSDAKLDAIRCDVAEAYTRRNGLNQAVMRLLARMGGKVIVQEKR